MNKEREEDIGTDLNLDLVSILILSSGSYYNVYSSNYSSKYSSLPLSCPKKCREGGWSNAVFVEDVGEVSIGGSTLRPRPHPLSVHWIHEAPLCGHHPCLNLIGVRQC